MQMRAAVLHQPNTPFQIETLTLDNPQAGEVLVRLHACGICHSDYHIATGDTKHPLPVVCGHEGAGIVEAVGAGVTAVKPGDHVIMNWTPDCGTCFYCQHGQPNLCDTYTGPIWAGVQLDGTSRLHLDTDPVYIYCGLGSFAEYAVVPQQSCIRIREDVPLKTAALVGCAVATGVGAVIHTAQVKPGSSVVVIGCGGVGLNIVQGAALVGAERIIAIDSNPTKMQMAQTFGATHTLLAGDDVFLAVSDLTGGRGADYAFEAVGLTKLQEQAMHLARPGGMAVFAGLAPMGTSTNLPGSILTREEKTVKGSYYGSVNPRRDFPLLIDLYMAGKLKLDELITGEYPLEEINSAYDAMLTGSEGRGVLVYD